MGKRDHIVPQLRHPNNQKHSKVGLQAATAAKWGLYLRLLYPTGKLLLDLCASKLIHYTEQQKDYASVLLLRFYIDTTCHKWILKGRSVHYQVDGGGLHPSLSLSPTRRLLTNVVMKRSYLQACTVFDKSGQQTVLKRWSSCHRRRNRKENIT